MWLFAAVSVAISMPAVRSWLETLFADLTIIFVQSIPAVALATVVAFVMALGAHLTTLSVHKTERESVMTMGKQQQVTSSSGVSSRRPATMQKLLGASLWTAAALTTALIPVSGMAADMSPALYDPSRRLAANNSVPYSLVDNWTALVIIDQHLTNCTYSGKLECVKNPTLLSAFGNYTQKPGYCSAFGAAYLNVSSSSYALPNQYLPIKATDAFEKGWSNKFSEWSDTNQEQFAVDCPQLYNQTIGTGEDYLCCTESQYEGLSTQVRLIPGQCTSCKENLRNVWCQFTCNPNNSMYVDVNEVRIVPGDDNHVTDVFAAIEVATYLVGDDWVRDIYDYCELDSSFTLLCNPTQGCTDGFGLLEFMGEYKLNQIGSPLQINFLTPDKMNSTYEEEILCACSDTDAEGCFLPMNSKLESCVGVCGSLCSVTTDAGRSYTEACFGATTSSSSTAGTGSSSVDVKWAELESYLQENLESTDFTTFNWILAFVGGILGCVLILGFIYASCHRRKYAAGSSDGGFGMIVVETPATGNASGIPRDSVTGAVKQKRLSFVDDFMSRIMKRWAGFVTTGNNPFLVITVTLIICIVCMIGLVKIEVESDPVKLWVSTSSVSYQNRLRFGELFRPFYRSEQIILVPKDGGIIGRSAYLKEAIRIQNVAANVTYGTKGDADYVELEDICWKVTGTTCTIQSITQYFQNDMATFEFYEKYGIEMEHFSDCIYSPQNTDVQGCSDLDNALPSGVSIPSYMTDCPCLSAFGSPMNLYNTILGGFPDGAEKNTTLYIQSTAIVSSILVYNYEEDSDNDQAIRWEREFIKRMKEESETNELFHVYLYAETSVEDEIKVESHGDMLPVALSYGLMLIYVAFGINRWTSNRRLFFQRSKILLGILGVICIMIAVATTIGIYMWAGVKLQLVIMEVVPFLSLAIGVDNIFLLVHAVSQKQEEWERAQPALFNDLARSSKEELHDVTSKLIAEGVGYIGPSIFMASAAECVAFVFGCISPMPVVMWFAAFSVTAVAINFCLQFTLLLSIMTLDKRRELSGKYDIICCKSASRRSTSVSRQDNDAPQTAPPASLLEFTQPKTPEDRPQDDLDAGQHFFDRVVELYASFLLNRFVKLVIMLIFLTWTFIAIYECEKIEHGLPQVESMPSSSYMIDYFNALDKYLATGAPVYYVVEGGYGRNPTLFDFNNDDVGAMFCRSKDMCEDFSVAKIVDALANTLDSELTHMSTGTTYSWIDDFWSFVSPDSECCRVNDDGSYLPIDTDNSTYTTWRTEHDTCLSASSTVPPVPSEWFMSLFSMFSTASAGTQCSYGGGSIYHGQFSIDNTPIPIVDSSTPAVKLNSTGYGKNITALSYMLTQTSNPDQQHFIDGLKQARAAAKWISEKTGIDVWAYSLTYVYFEQYLTITNDSFELIGLAILAIFIIHLIYFGSFWYPLIVIMGVLNVVVQVAGFMYPLGIQLNGLSMVNLIIAAGISVEFCGHFVRMFARAHGNGTERAKDALRKVLVSVLFGITITKVVGLSMLTLADSRIFIKYYFRMYMAVVVCGVLNGMVLMPVVLSTIIDVRDFYRNKEAQKQHARDVQNELGASPAFQGGGEAMKYETPPAH